MTKLGKNIQKGFTLIELMIVVAIIGILAAIAIPQYQNYVARAQISEAVNLMGGAKTPLEEFISSNGAFPDGTSSGETLADLGIAPNNGKYVASITIAEGTADDNAGQLIAQMAGSGVASQIQGKELALTRTASGEWTCSTGPASGDPVGSEFLPSSCRGAVPTTF